MINKTSIAITVAGLAALIGAACGDDSSDGERTPVIDPGDGGDYAPDLDPADFVRLIDNPYLPFIPGSRWVYESDDGPSGSRSSCSTRHARFSGSRRRWSATR